MRHHWARVMYVVYFAVSPTALANWAMAKSDALYSSESDGSSVMYCRCTYPACRPRIVPPWVVPPLELLSIRVSAAAVSKPRAPKA